MLTYRYLPVSWRSCIPLNVNPKIPNPPWKKCEIWDFTFFNPSLCRILGYTREEILGTNYKVLMDAENAKKVFQVFSEVYVTGIPARGFEWEVIKKDGAKAYFEVLISLIVKPGEKPTRFRGIARDITERKRMEEKL
jgi:PAS domain S-box-containing protein